jgi:hypothetical protein
MKKILKIHFDPPSTKFGTGNFIMNFSNHLNINNYQVTNICCNRYDFESFYNSDVIFASRRIKKRLPFFTYFYELICLEIYSLIYFFLNFKRIDLIITYNDCGILINFFAKILKKKTSKYLFLLLKDLSELTNREKIKYIIKKNNKFNLKILFYKFLNFLENKTRICLEEYELKNHINFITASSFVKKRIKKKNILINYYFSKISNTILSKKINLKKNILLIGNDIYSKGIVKFFHVISRDKKFFQENTQIDIVGISNIKEANFWTEKFGVSNLVNCYSHKRNIREFYEKCDIFVNLSRIEGWNISIMDAYLLKKKILSTKVGCIRELFLNDKNVQICSQNNLNEIYSKLVNIVNSNEIFSESCYQKIVKKLDEKKIFNDYKLFIQKIIND